MPQINIIGSGTGDKSQITKAATDAILKSDYLIGDKRLIDDWENENKVYLTSSHDIKNFLAGIDEKATASILVSGDVGFYSLSKSLLKALESSPDFHKIKLICGIGSLQYFSSKLKISWDDAIICSLHGRDGNIIGKVMKNRKVFILTDAKNTPASICSLLCDFGLDYVDVSIGENLSYSNEKITNGKAYELKDLECATLSVVMIINEKPIYRQSIAHGLADDMFIRGDVPMTKQEIRSISISKLQLGIADVIYDIGAGTGSMSIEMALIASDGIVYAVERKDEGIELINKNREKFGTNNLKIIKSFAPDGLLDIEKPDKVFIGGSSGNLKEIIDAIYKKNEMARIVINAISLETLGEAMDYYKSRNDYTLEVINVMVSKAKTLGDYHMMTGQNPVFIITASREE
jgi:precorrin-6Y C5,15-methyltransferase (decarboxylating)